MRSVRCRGILDGIEIAAAPGKTAQALQLAAHFKSLGFLTVVSGIDVTSLDLMMAPGDGLKAVDALGIAAHHGTGARRGKAGAKPSPPMPRFWKSMERRPGYGSPEQAFRHGAMTSGARSGRSSALPKHRLTGSTGHRFRISTPSSIAPKASTRTSATISTGSSGPTARPSCWAACWNRAAWPPSARSTGSAARYR